MKFQPNSKYSHLDVQTSHFPNVDKLKSNITLCFIFWKNGIGFSFMVFFKNFYKHSPYVFGHDGRLMVELVF